MASPNKISFFMILFLFSSYWNKNLDGFKTIEVSLIII